VPRAEAQTRSRAAAALFASTVGAVTLAFGLAPAGARTAGIPVRIDYRAPAGCGQESSFLERLIARSAHVRQASPGEPSAVLTVVVVVRVTRQGRVVHGHLVIQDVDGSPSSRDVDGDTCESVESALVLVSALAIDPTATGATQTGQPVATGTTGTTVGNDGGSAPGQETATPEKASKAVPAPDAAPPAPSASSETSVPSVPRGPALDTKQGWHLAVGAGVQAAWGTAPDVVAGVPAFVDLGRTGSSPASPWSPSLRAGFLYANSGDQTVTGGEVRLVQTLGMLDLCPVRLSVWNLRMIPCAHGEGGGVGASGQGITPARSQTRPWLAVGALGRVRYVAISPFFIELYGGLDVQLQRDRFFFEPDNTVFRVPVVSGFATAAVGATIL
jgi:hypothetical protein